MSDSGLEIDRMVVLRHQRMSVKERMAAASALFDAARTIVDSSLPPGLAGAERRLALAIRLYADELPPSALRAHAEWSGHEDRPEPSPTPTE